MESAKPPIPQSKELPAPNFIPLPNIICDDVEMFEIKAQTVVTVNLNIVVLIVRVIRDVNLSKKSAELLASRLKEKNCLQRRVTITSYRNR